MANARPVQGELGRDAEWAQGRRPELGPLDGGQGRGRVLAAQDVERVAHDGARRVGARTDQRDAIDDAERAERAIARQRSALYAGQRLPARAPTAHDVEGVASDVADVSGARRVQRSAAEPLEAAQ